MGQSSKSPAKSTNSSWDEAALNAEVDRLLLRHGKEKAALIPLLLDLQAQVGYLPDQALNRICEKSEITPSTLTGVLGFYRRFRRRPVGRHRILVCVGTACHVKGAESVYHAFRRQLHLAEGEDTDSEGLFTVEKAACLGCCMLAPAVQIDQTIYGHLSPQRVENVLRDFLRSADAGAEQAVVTDGEADGGEVRLCRCSSCRAAGADAVFAAVQQEINEQHFPIRLREVACAGLSTEAPLLEIVPARQASFYYGCARAETVSLLLQRHFQPPGLSRKWRQAISSLLAEWTSPLTLEVRYPLDLRDGPLADSWHRQKRIVTEGSGRMSPLDLEDYRKNHGFMALQQAMKETPEAIIQQVARSGLRGRGGAGYPTADKWEAVRCRTENRKIVICNGDEGDPGAFMDRMLLESFPFRILEGMAIAAYAVGATEGILYIRAEYPLAVQRMRQAVEILQDRKVLDHLTPADGTAFSFSVHVVEGAGAFVCGEETALLAALEGRRGMPQFRPPYPAEKGLWGMPTLINNVETLAAIPWIIHQGAEHFAACGTASSKGTKTFALAGKVVRGGLVEVPMGMSLREIVEKLGGGVPAGRQLKAILVGGPSGGCIPAEQADLPVDFETLTQWGAMMGSGGLVVLDDTDCMLDIARYFMTFTREESCGKCTCGRIGVGKMLEILNRLCTGHGRNGDIERLEELAKIVQQGSLCGLGRSAPNPILTTLRYFRAEYDAHLAGQCPAGKCRELIVYETTDDCIGCTRCAQRCPVNAIALLPHQRQIIDAEICIRCDTCRQVCPVNAIAIRPR